MRHYGAMPAVTLKSDHLSAELKAPQGREQQNKTFPFPLYTHVERKCNKNALSGLVAL